MIDSKETIIKETDKTLNRGNTIRKEEVLLSNNWSHLLLGYVTIQQNNTCTDFFIKWSVGTQHSPLGLQQL